MINSDSNSKVFSKRFANRSIENSKAWFSYGSFKIRHFWEYHSSGGICGWNGRLYALSGCEIDLFLCLDVIEINDFISVKMRNRNCVSGCEWNSCQDVKYTSCGVIGWNERWNGLSGCETNMVHCDVDSCMYLWKRGLYTRYMYEFEMINLVSCAMFNFILTFKFLYLYLRIVHIVSLLLFQFLSGVIDYEPFYFFRQL